MNNHKQHPWFGLDDLGAEEIASLGSSDPKPLYNEKSQRDQDKALQNPEQSIDKDPEKPWVQGNENEEPANDAHAGGTNKKSLRDNGDPSFDEWAQPEEPKKGIPRPR